MWMTLFLWAVSFLISDYFRPRLPEQDPSGAGDFQAPTATEGRKVPQIVGGTVKVLGPNTLYSGDWEAEPVTVETGIVFKEDETVGYLYRIGLALGQFQGEAAGMTAIFMGDDKIWDYVDDNGGVPGLVADINLPDLFGGETKGGGFVGRVRAFNGASGQPVSSYLLSKNPLQSAWPSFCYVVITDFAETAGAEIGESNALRDIRVEWQTYDTVANGGLGDNLSLGNDHHIIGRDYNPICAAINVVTNPDYGLSLGEINYTNFQAAAETCWNEGIGYSNIIDNEVEAKAVLNEIEKHIDGYFGTNPTTGLLEVTLARQGYTPAAEFQATEDNIKDIIDYAKPEWPQTKNEVKIRFINREKNYNDDHAVAQDMAGRLITGRPQSITIRFPGLRTAAAANAVVARVSRTYFWPLAKFGLEMDRTAYAVRPGDVVMVTHPDIAAVDLPTRCTRISVGDPVKQTIRVDVVQDVFGAELGTQSAPVPSGHVPPTSTPVVIGVHYATMAPRWLMEINSVTLEPRLLFLVGRDNPNTAYSLGYETRAAFGSGAYSNIFAPGGPITPFTRYGVLTSPLIQLNSAAVNNATTSDVLGGGFDVDGPNLSSTVGSYSPTTAFNGLAIINPGQPNEEFVAIKTITSRTGGITCSAVYRGVGDTAIQAHAQGEPVFFIDTGVYMQPYARPGDFNFGLAYKLVPIAQGTTGADPGYGNETQVTDRGYVKPYPPTGLTITSLHASNWFPPGIIDMSYPDSISAPTDSGLFGQILNRRFDQANAIYGAGSYDDVGAVLAVNTFTDVDPTLNWWIYDLDATPSPVQGTDAVASGTILGLNDRTNAYAIPQSELFDKLGLTSPFNGRFEFMWSNEITLDEVVADNLSRPLYLDRVVNFLPNPEGYDVVAETVLLLHMEGFDRTTQFIDYSPYAHTVTRGGDAEVDTDVAEDTGMGPGSLILDPASPIEYLEVPDHSAFNFAVDPGYTIQCRVQFTETPSGDTPLVTKWETSGSQRQFWFGLVGTTLQFRHSVDGSAQLLETTVAKTWTPGVWYDIAVTVWPANVYFFVNGVFSERETMTWTDAFNSTAPVRIGADGDGTAIAQTVNIDEVRILAKPFYKAPYTKNVVPYPGRDVYQPLLALFNNAEDLDSTYVTEDPNHQTLQFSALATTKIDASDACFSTSPLSKSLYIGGTSGSNASFDNQDGVRVNQSGSAGTLARNWDFAYRDWTIELFVKLEVPPASQPNGSIVLISKYNRGPFPFLEWYLYITKSASPTLNFVHRSPTAIDKSAISPTLTESPLSGVWYHVAVCRKDGIVSLFWNGNRVAQNLTDFIGRDMSNLHPANVCLGRLEVQNGNDHSSMQGWLDNVRVLNGVAAYDGATYTIPTSYFVPDDLYPQAELPLLSAPSDWSPLHL